MLPQLARLATDIFTEVRKAPQTQPLKVLAFGVMSRSSRFPLPKYFIEGEIKGLHHTRRTALAVPLQYLDLERYPVHILDHDWRAFTKGQRTNWKNYAYWIWDDDEL